MTIRTDNPIPTTDPRQLTTADLAACLDLSDNREWPREDRKWEFLLRVGQGHGIVAPDGKLAATAVLTHFGDFAAISMVLVAAQYDGRGLGTRIMRHVMAKAATVCTLYATVRGEPLYTKLGFRVTSVCDAVTGTFTGRPAGTTRRASPSDLPAIRAVDPRVTGVDRAVVLAGLVEFADEVRVVERDGVVTGYAARHRSLSVGGSQQIGPVIAASDADARALISDLAVAGGGTSRLDLDHARPDLIAWAAENGLSRLFTAKAMTTDGAVLPGERDQLYVPMLQAIG